MQIFTQYSYAWRNVLKILNLLFDTFHCAKLFLLKSAYVKSAYVTCHFCKHLNYLSFKSPYYLRKIINDINKLVMFNHDVFYGACDTYDLLMLLVRLKSDGFYATS